MLDFENLFVHSLSEYYFQIVIRINFMPETLSSYKDNFKKLSIYVKL